MRKQALLTILLTVSLRIIACGPGYYPNDYYHNLFKQELLSDSSLFLLLYDEENVFYGNYSPESTKTNSVKDPNVLSWESYLNIGYNQVYDLIYVLPLNDVCKLKLALNRGSKYDGKTYGLRALQEGKRDSFLDYLNYAKRCAKEATYVGRYYYDSIIGEHKKSMEQLIKEGEVLLAEQQNDEMKHRYLFQLVRLAHYKGEFKRATEYFKQSQDIDKKGYIYYRCMEQAAGAYAGLDSNLANYFFAKVFHELPDRREICLTSFKISTQNEWDDAISHCKTNEEKAVFNMMRAMKRTGSEYHEMENILNANSHSMYLDVLLLRLINQYERVFHSTESEWLYEEDEKKSMREKIPQIIQLNRRFLENNEDEHREQLYILATSYLYFLYNNTSEAEKMLDRNTFSEAFHTQEKALRLAYFIDKQKGVTNYVENTWYQQVLALSENSDYEQFKAYCLDELDKKYLAEGSLGKSFLCHHRAIDAREHLHKPLVNRLWKLQQKTNKTVFEEERIMGRGLDRDVYSDLLGTYYLQHNKLDSAVYYFQKIGTGYEMKANVFTNAIFSGVIKFPYFNQPFDAQCDNLHLKYFNRTKTIDKIELANLMLQVKIEADTTSKQERKALCNLMLANAWNNMHIEEWHRHILYFKRENGTPTPYGPIRKIYELPKEAYKSWPEYQHYSNEYALSYTKKALEATKNPEFKAQISFAGMRAELHGAQTSGYVYEEQYYNLKSSVYAYQLANAYSNTEYYQQAISQCERFNIYVKGK